MTKRIALALIPIALTLTPLAALGLTYDDIGDFFTGAINRAAGSQSQPAPVPFNSPTRAGAIGYSSFGSISEREIAIMQNLAFPQSAHAMRNRFGSPSYISGQAEWFDRADGSFLVVNYQDDRAVSVEVKN